jgi:hypothetical protein
MEFHISRLARDRYQFDETLFTLSGNVIFANFHAARIFAQKINQTRDLVNYPEQAVRAGQINALGLIDEILHYVIAMYRQQQNPQTVQQALAYLDAHLNPTDVDRTLSIFASEFPPTPVYQGKQTLDAYLSDTTDGVSNREVLLEELVLLWLTNRNPACEVYEDLFDDSRLTSDTSYARVIANLRQFFKNQPTFGPDSLDLISMLRSPAEAMPYSLTGQLEYIREHWSALLGRYLYRLLSSLDLVKEEDKAALFGGGVGPGPTVIPVYDQALLAGEQEYEAFSPDREWMPRLVLIAKNTYVWLDQLSKQYQRSITHLDQVPDEELNELAQRGFTGLWLIGLWERSQASARVKQLCGNADAIASAYSLHDYSIAADLGGEAAYQSLHERAWRHGIRLASDMVPNHMGIDSKWVIDHPDWFVQLDYAPYPAYSFNGADLSNDPAVSIHIEDHYFSRDDAAVVFKYYDHRDNRTRYIYHGNDGTTMPWNDTAQLNYMKAEVREAVIQTILAVAKRFPIIRFDAAMTLAKRHYQRLWFPEPGTGGAIPSRAEHGMTKEQFNEVFPTEFWREVVDRVAREAPDTLLLAEAFWLMEGYFVRTLGMHRVYNSAFMNMLRNEENAKYRMLIKNTLEFDPEILRRYVNFMNNPDERTAAEQFGKGDKYFGVCLLMATLPGLPMFGHGQLEGYTEKYGMEFRRALWDETPDTGLVERHRREISPILHRRAIFAGVENFQLYDFYTADGGVDEDVLAYSNNNGGESGLVIVHNRFSSTAGRIRTSAAALVKGAGSDRSLVQRSLVEGLGLGGAIGWYTIAYDQITHQEFIFSSQELAQNGLQLSLSAYEYHVFLNFREVQDDEWGSYSQLCGNLNGHGVPSIQEALHELVLQPVLFPLREIANPGYFNYLNLHRIVDAKETVPVKLLEEAVGKQRKLLEGVSALTGYSAGVEKLLLELRRTLETILSFDVLSERYPLPASKNYQTALNYLLSGLDEEHSPRSHWPVLISWLFVHNLGKLAGTIDFEALSRSWIDEWHLDRVVEDNARQLGFDDLTAVKTAALVRLLTEQQCWFATSSKLPVAQILSAWLADSEVQHFLGINRFKDVLWFNQESYEEFVWWMNLLAVLDTLAEENTSASLLAERVLICFDITRKLLAAAKDSGYQVARLLEALK